MSDLEKICQSCGMPLNKDPNNGGSNSDKSKSYKYCSFCYQNGRFTDEGISLKEKIEKNIRIAVLKLKLSETKARQMAENLLPTLERWKGKKI